MTIHTEIVKKDRGVLMVNHIEVVKSGGWWKMVEITQRLEMEYSHLLFTNYEDYISGQKN